MMWKNWYLFPDDTGEPSAASLMRIMHRADAGPVTLFQVHEPLAAGVDATSVSHAPGTFSTSPPMRESSIFTFEIPADPQLTVAGPEGKRCPLSSRRRLRG